MHPYRTHTCGSLRRDRVGTQVRLSGWVNRRRDHGGLLFLDLRDHYGLTQCVVEPDSPAFREADRVRSEWVVTVTGPVVARTSETINPEMPTGEVEVRIEDIRIQSVAQELPVPVFGDQEYPEEMRLKYRFLDLRSERLHRNITLRSKVIQSIRRRMIEQGFTEFQTPILTASSPEGARDFLVPSRLHPGKFYALPQAPQQFKQLIMVAGFDRYFQIAPCFRDEDARADRSPGEFYQLDLEMSFVTQDDVFAAVEPVLAGVFEEFAEGRHVSPAPFRRISYDEALLKYGSDKPDLRNPLIMSDVTEIFRNSEFKVFANIIANDESARVWAIPAPGGGNRAFCDRINSWAQNEGQPGIGYIFWRLPPTLEELGYIQHHEMGEIAEQNSFIQARKRFDQWKIDNPNGAMGPIAKKIGPEKVEEIRNRLGLAVGDAAFFVTGNPVKVRSFAGNARNKLGRELGLVSEGGFEFCWVVDFPMYEWNEERNQIDFSHNPFSMPNFDRAQFLALDPQDRETILGMKAFQYDIVCNGVELSSGAIRNHDPDVMLKAFEIAGYSREETEARFSGMLNAFRYGAPPHGGTAPGIDRIVMLIAGEENLREVTMFPMNQQAQDLMMGAPSEVSEKQLRELHIRAVPPEKS